MKLTSVAVLLVLLATSVDQQLSLDDPLKEASTDPGAGPVEVSFLPRAVMEGEPLSVRATVPGFAGGKALVGLYRDSGEPLTLVYKTVTPVVNGSIAADYMYQFKTGSAGRYLVVVLADVYGMGNFLPESITRASLDSVRGGALSEVKELFVHPRSYVTVTPRFEHILGSGWNRYDLRHWSFWEDARRDDTWCALGPQALLGSIYRPASGPAELFRRTGSAGSFRGYNYYAVMANGTAVDLKEEYVEGKDQVTYIARPYTNGFQYSTEATDWDTRAAVQLHPEELQDLRAPAVATDGRVTVTVEKSRLALAPELFDAEMRELGDLRLVRERHPEAVVPCTGFATIQALYSVRSAGVLTASTVCNFFGSGTAVLELPLAGEYRIGAAFDRDPYLTVGEVYYSYELNSRLDVSRKVTASGDWLGIRPERELFAPGENVTAAASYPESCTANVVLYVDGKKVAETALSPKIGFGALNEGTHELAAVLATEETKLVRGCFGLSTLEGTGWVSCAEVTVGAMGVSLSLPEKFVEHLNSPVRVVVHDGAGASLPGADVQASFEYRERSGTNRTVLGKGLTDAAGSFVFDFVPPEASTYYPDAQMHVSVRRGALAQEVYRHVRIEIQGLRGFISTDKPMYKGGDTVRSKLTVWDLDRLEPAQGQALCRFINPQGRTIYQQDLELDGWGTCRMDIPLGSEMAWGMHALELRFAGALLARSGVIIKPYTLPMTRLTLDAGTGSVGVGERLSVSAFAEYTLFSAPVGNGTVTYDIAALGQRAGGLYGTYASSSQQSSGQGQGQGQAQGQSQDRSQGPTQGPGPYEGGEVSPVEDRALTPVISEEEYLDSLTRLFSWDGVVRLDRGQGWINLTVPPLASALRVRAVFEDELDHRNEETLVLHIGERPAFVGNALSVAARKGAFAASEPVALVVRSELPCTPVVLSVHVADASGDSLLAGERHLLTGSDCSRNISLQELFIDVRGLSGLGYHSYVVSARFPSDRYPRSNAVFTVHRFGYEALSDRTTYRAGDTVRLDLSVSDLTDPLGPENAIRDESFLVRLAGGGGRALEVAGRTARGVAHVELGIPAGAAAGLWTVETVFEYVTVRNVIEVVGPSGARLTAAVASAGEDEVRISVGLGAELGGTVFLDARNPSLSAFRQYEVRGAGEFPVPRLDRFRPLSVLVYSFTPDGLRSALVRVPPDRQDLTVEVSTDRPTYEPGEIVNVTLATGGTALVYLGIVSNALFYGIPTVEEDWFSADAASAGTAPWIASGWAREQRSQAGLSRRAGAFHPSDRTCPLPYSPHNGGQSQGGNGGGADGNGGGVGQGQGQGQGQSGGGGAAQEVNEFVPRDLDMGADMKGDMEGLRMRKWFTDAAYWNGGIVVSGSTTLAVTLPDNVRTWRITAVGLSDRCDGAVAVAKFNVKKPFYVEMRLPSTLTQDDEVVFKALVYNFHNYSLRAMVGFYAGPWLKVFGQNEQWLDMEPESVYTVQFQVKVAGAGRQNLTLLATDFRDSRDGVFAELVVKANTVECRRELAGVVDDGLSFRVSPEAFSVRELFSAMLTVSFRYEGLIMEGLESMCEYPYGCNEQTMTCLLPNILVWRYLENLGRLSPSIREELTRNILHGIEKLLYTQHDDGGWGWYKQDRTHSFMTAWILYGLSIVQRGGFYIDPAVFSDGQQALLDMMDRDGGWTGTRWMQGNNAAMSAFCVLALAASGYPGPLMDRAVSHLLSLWAGGTVNGAYETALISLALSEAHLDGLPMASWLVLSMKDDHWEGKALGGAVETTGWASQAIVKAGLHETAERSLGWLVARRSGYGWGGTSSTMAVLLAFDEATLPGALNGGRPGNVTLSVDGTEVRRWSGGAGKSPVDLSPLIWPDGAVVSFTTDIPGTAFYKFTQIDHVRPPVTVAYTGNITTTTGKLFELGVRATVDPACGGRIGLSGLDARLPSHPDLQVLEKTALDESGEVTVRMVALGPGTYRLMPLVVSYQFSGNGGKSSLVREYVGPVTVRAGDVTRELTQEVSIEKTVSQSSLGINETANVTLTVRAWGSALGRTAEVRDFLPGGFTKLLPDDLDTVAGVGEPGAGTVIRHPHEKRWRFALSGCTTLAYDIRAVGDYHGDLGKAAVLLDGYLVNVSGRPAIGTAGSGMFVSREHSARSIPAGSPVEITLRFGSTIGFDYYVALEDTLPPGFEADRRSLDACLRGEVLSYCVRGDQVTFFMNTLEVPMELTYRAIPGMPGSFVVPPARLFPMYSSEIVVFSGSADLVVTEAGDATQGDDGGFSPRRAPAAAPAERREPASPAEAAREGAAKAAPAGPAAVDGEPAGELPDIRVDRIRTIGEPENGADVLFVADIVMTGFGQMIPLTVYAYIDEQRVRQESIQLSGPDCALNVHFGWVATPGPHTVRVVADPLNWVDESDETNNMLEAGVYVQHPAATERRATAPWQAGLLALDALICFVLTVKLADPMSRYLGKRRERRRGAGSGER